MPDWQQRLFSEPPTREAAWSRGLDPALVTKALALQDLAAQEGIPLRITTGYRSPAEQERLYAQGRTTPGPIVTNARPGQSRHQHGRAIDVVPLKDGQPDWRSPHWARLGELGTGLGLEWGGTWKRLTDRPHFQLATDTPAAPDRSAVVQQIRQEARRQGVDPDLAVAVATQESSLDPGRIGDQGRSRGLFQLQAAAAIDAGIDPARRGEPALNIRGGVGYLKQGLARFGGDVRQALERHYNRGGDPDYYAHVMQYYPGQTTRVAAGSQAAPAPRDGGQARVATPAPGPPAARDGGQAAGAGLVDWNARLFGPAAAPQTDWRAELSAPPPDTAQQAPRAWGQELGFAPGAGSGASEAPAAPVRGWAAVLFS